MVDKEGEDLIADMTARTALEEAGVKDLDPKCFGAAKDAVAPSVKDFMKKLEESLDKGKALDMDDDSARAPTFKKAVEAYEDCKKGRSGI